MRASVSILQTAMRERIAVGHNRNGAAVPIGHCRHAKEGCDRRLAEFAHYLVDAGQAYGIDPWLMAAMAFRESGLNPFAKGAIGELGILQINPGRRDARQVRFIRDDWYRQRCRKEPGACQREIVEHAAQVLSRSLDAVRRQPAGRARRLQHRATAAAASSYAKRVLLERDELLQGRRRRGHVPTGSPRPPAPNAHSRRNCDSH